MDLKDMTGNFILDELLTIRDHIKKNKESDWIVMETVEELDRLIENVKTLFRSGKLVQK